MSSVLTFLASTVGRWAVFLAVCASFWVWGYVVATHHQKSHAEAIQAQFDAFKALTTAAGKQAEAAAKSRVVTDQHLKESADHENTRTAADLRARVERLRDRNTAGRLLPGAPAGASRPDLTCYDRPEFERAIGEFLADARRIADQGSQAALDLNTSKEWVLRLKLSEAVAQP